MGLESHRSLSGVLKEMRQKEAGSSAQVLRREEAARLLHLSESSSDTTFSKNLLGSFPELEGPLLCLAQMPGAYALTSAELCRL